jgi:hypothetical protein
MSLNKIKFMNGIFGIHVHALSLQSMVKVDREAHNNAATLPPKPHSPVDLDSSGAPWGIPAYQTDLAASEDGLLVSRQCKKPVVFSQVHTCMRFDRGLSTC